MFTALPCPSHDSVTPPRDSFGNGIGCAPVTPPKTPASCSRIRRALAEEEGFDVAKSTHQRFASCSNGAQEITGTSPLPSAVCQTVTIAVWSHAKKQAEKDAMLECSSIDVAASASSTASRKRQRSISVERLEQRVSQGWSQSQSQSLTQSELVNTAGDKGFSVSCEEAEVALHTSLAQIGGSHEVATLEQQALIKSMAINAASYWREVSVDLGKAAHSLARFCAQQRRLYWRRPSWRGVNLGGWLLMEPGPNASIFDAHGPASSEWELMSRMRASLGDEGARQEIQVHRDTFITEDDFRRIHALGLNAVRIPFGYWVVTGSTNGDPYIGPCLEYLDRAVAWAQAHDLQVLLDLHGAPGGESSEHPCGREHTGWCWEDWRFEESLRVLELVAKRYKGHPAVTGIGVCNEPSETVPAKILCNFFARAVHTIRENGMPPDEVAITLSIFRADRLDAIWRVWNREFDGSVLHANVAFDLHIYHCFGPWWTRQDLGAHLRMAKRHRKILRRVPAVVGEWSLSLPRRAQAGDEDEVMRAFAAAQFDAYSQASHGWFFWNWRDGPAQPMWDMRQCVERRWISKAQLVDLKVEVKAASN